MGPPKRPTRSARPLAPLALLGLALGACSGGVEGPAEGAPRFERPELSRATPRPERPRIERHQELTVPEGEAPWRVEADEHKVGEVDGAPALQFPGAGVRKVIVPGEFDPARFNQLVVRGKFLSPYKVTLTLASSTGGSYQPPPLVSRRSNSEQTILFDLPKIRNVPHTYHFIGLEFDGAPRGFELRGIDLLDLPIGLYLPDPDEGGGMVDIGIESRFGVGLTKGDPLECEFEVTSPEDELSFGCALLEHLRANGQEPRVRVEIQGGGKRIERAVELENDRKERSEWHDLTVPLAELVGERVTARFHFETSSDRLALCALVNVHVTRRGDAPATALLVTSDTHRADHIGSAGLGVELETSAIDALAARGALFEDCWVTTNVTSPSHVALMTARHPRDTRLVSNTGLMADEAYTLAEAFRSAGFHTIGVVSVRHLGPGGTGLGQGFDRMIAPMSSPWNAGEAVGMLEHWIEAADGLPVFAWLHVFDAHEPYEPPESHDRLYYPADKDPFDPTLPELSIEKGSIPKSLAAIRDLEFPRAQYRAEISYLDEELGRLLELPRVRSGVAAVTSDHGEILEKDGTYFNHGELYPDTLHVPLVLAGPGVPEGVRVATPIMQTDVGRTLLDLAGATRVEFPGRNLLFALEGDGGPTGPRFALSAHGSSASIEQDGWFLLLHLRAHKGPLARERELHETELFSLADDPECLTDVDGEERARARELRATLVQWLGDRSGPSLSRDRMLTAAGAKELAALGYALNTDEVGEDEPWYDETCDCDNCEVYR